MLSDTDTDLALSPRQSEAIEYHVRFGLPSEEIMIQSGSLPRLGCWGGSSFMRIALTLSRLLVQHVVQEGVLPWYHFHLSELRML